MKFWPPRTWIAAVLLLSPTIAGSGENLSGSWREEYEEDIRSVEQWDARCGEAPRSPGRRDRGLVFTVEDRGVELQFASPSGRFSTSDCQSSHPDIRPREMTLKEGLFLKNCSTADDALDYESGLYSFRVMSPDRIEYRETTRYSRHTADGALCVHTRRVQRRYSRIASASASTAEPTVETADAGTTGGVPPDAGAAAADDGGEEPGDDACRHPGPVRQLRAIPSMANVLVGETFCPRLEGRDASGCVVDVRPDRQPPEPLRGVLWTEDGCLRVTDRAPGGTRSIEIRAQGAATEVQLVILRRLEPTPRTSPDPPPPAPVEEPAAEAEPPDGDAEPSPPPAPPTQPSPSAPAVSEPSGDGLPLFLALAGAAALLGLMPLVAIRRRFRRPSAPVPAPAPVSPAPAEAPLENLPTVPAMPRAQGALDPIAGGSFCTECGRALPAGARFCPFDRTPVAGAAPTANVEKTCPSCGRTLPPSARFCPYDRTPLTEDDPP